MPVIYGLELSGAHVKQLSDELWYGSFGGCNICGCSEEGFLIPRAVRYWDPDDGWKSGVLCRPCLIECSERGPQKEDFAYSKHTNKYLIDIAFELEDPDGANSTCQDFD